MGTAFPQCGSEHGHAGELPTTHTHTFDKNIVLVELFLLMLFNKIDKKAKIQ